MRGLPWLGPWDYCLLCVPCARAISTSPAPNCVTIHNEKLLAWQQQNKCEHSVHVHTNVRSRLRLFVTRLAQFSIFQYRYEVQSETFCDTSRSIQYVHTDIWSRLRLLVTCLAQFSIFACRCEVQIETFCDTSRSILNIFIPIQPPPP